MEPYYDHDGVTLYYAENMDVLPTLADASVDSVVTDPPYGLQFMGKAWDYNVPDVATWAECLRVLKPGGHLLAFAGTRTQHRMAVNIEDAGFEIRDMLAWVYGSGFPKSLDVSKAIDKEAGVEFSERPASGVGFMNPEGRNGYNVTRHQLTRTGESTEAAQQWDGWGTALKPSLEPITLARKPLAGTVAQTVLEHGTGALNIDASRIGTEQRINGPASPTSAHRKSRVAAGYRHDDGIGPGSPGGEVTGRWPANLLHDGSDEVAALFPDTGPAKSGGQSGTNGNPMSWGEDNQHRPRGGHNDHGGSATRFYYVAKASTRDRGEGNTHETVKPLALMHYLCRLVTPPRGVILDPYAGSGTTLIAARDLRFQVIGIDHTEQSCAIAVGRLDQGVLDLA